MKVFPSWRYHRTHAPRLIQNEHEDAALGDEWTDTPAVFLEEPKDEKPASEAPDTKVDEPSVDEPKANEPVTDSPKKRGRKSKVSA